MHEGQQQVDIYGLYTNEDGTVFTVVALLHNVTIHVVSDTGEK